MFSSLLALSNTFWNFGFWSFRSSEDRIRDGRLSFWSILETIVAVLIFWYCTISFHTFLFLYSSLIVAPLLLIRSERSVSRGAEIFQNGLLGKNWEQRGEEDYGRYTANCWLAGIPLGFLISIFLIWIFQIAFTQGGETRSGFIPLLLSALFLCLLSIPASAALFAGLGAGAGPGPGRSGTFYLPRAIPPVQVSVLWWLSAVPSLALASRVIATITNLREGYSEIPNNIWRISFSTAPLTSPELVPGLGVDSSFRFSNVIHLIQISTEKGKSLNQLIDVIFISLITVVWWLPPFFYRLMLKSTMWLWWILFVFGGIPKKTDDLGAIRADTYVKISGKTSIVLSIVTICLFLFGGVLNRALGGDFKDFRLLAVLWIFTLPDWSSVSIINIFSLLTSIANLVIVFWVNSVWVDVSLVPARMVDPNKQARNLSHFITLKSILGALSIFFTMAYILLLLLHHRYGVVFDHWLLIKLHTIYGVHANIFAEAI